MSKKESVLEKYTTGKGEIVGFVAIQKPSTKFNKEGVYSVNILLPKEEGEALAAKIKAIRTEQYKTYGKGTKVADLTRCVPYTTPNEEGEEIEDAEGRYVVKASAKAFIKNDKATHKIVIVDSKLKPINNDISIGEGTTARLGLELAGYSVAGKTGVSVKLALVQIIDLVSFSKELLFLILV